MTCNVQGSPLFRPGTFYTILQLVLDLGLRLPETPSVGCFQDDPYYYGSGMDGSELPVAEPCL